MAAAKDALAASIGSGNGPTDAEVRALASALGVSLSAPAGADPGAELSAVKQALTSYTQTLAPPMAGSSSLEAATARRLDETDPTGGCGGSDCWITTPGGDVRADIRSRR